MTKSKALKAIVTVLIPLILWIIPSSSLGIEGITVLEHRVLAIFSFAILSWVLEPIPIFATSVLIIVLEILTLSTGGIGFFKNSVSETKSTKEQQSYQQIVVENTELSAEKVSEIITAKKAAKLSLELKEQGQVLSEANILRIDQAEAKFNKVQNAHKKNNAGLISYKSIIYNFAHPIIMLFLGGFFLAAAATKYRLDINLARILVKPFGTKPATVTLGVMLITAVFSMFMSNTACTAMMLAIVAPILHTMSKGDKGRIALALAVPFAANIGGFGTPIGTPPNAVAMKYLTDNYAISFDQWMLFGIPLSMVLLFITWQILTRFYKAECPKITLDLKGEFLKTPQAYVVYLVFAGTILLWITGKFHGIPSSIVALIPVAVFTATGVMTSKDLQKLSWDVLWLISGGFALGAAMEKTGLSSSLVNSIPFASMSPIAIIAVAAVVGTLMATFMSNTATANLILPIMASLAVALGPVLQVVGGYQGLIIAVTLSTSLGMALPISTPPNAMAHATGMIDTKEMAKMGSLISIIGLVCIFICIFLMKTLGFFGQ